jgi:hypothetical protein
VLSVGDDRPWHPVASTASAWASLWQADMLSCSFSEADRHNTIFTLAATPLACSAAIRSMCPNGQQQ